MRATLRVGVWVRTGQPAQGLPGRAAAAAAAPPVAGLTAEETETPLCLPAPLLPTSTGEFAAGAESRAQQPRQPGRCFELAEEQEKCQGT